MQNLLRFSKLLFLLFLLTFNSCRKEEPVILETLIEDDTPSMSFSNSISGESEKSIFHDDEIILGEKLKNPYSVSNMQKAFENIKSNFADLKTLEINCSHFYVRFLPDSEEELNTLNALSLELFDYPLDYKIEKRG